MLVKIHSTYRNVVAICDSDLIGKTFGEGQKCLFVNPNFFQGEEKSEKEVLDIIEKGLYEDYTFNIVGRQSTDLALKAGIIRSEGIINIQNIPIALILL